MFKADVYSRNMHHQKTLAFGQIWIHSNSPQNRKKSKLKKYKQATDSSAHLTIYRCKPKHNNRHGSKDVFFVIAASLRNNYFVAFTLINDALSQEVSKRSPGLKFT